MYEKLAVTITIAETTSLLIHQNLNQNFSTGHVVHEISWYFPGQQTAVCRPY
jgi:hypothetical protein